MTPPNNCVLKYLSKGVLKKNFFLSFFSKKTLFAHFFLFIVFLLPALKMSAQANHSLFFDGFSDYVRLDNKHPAVFSIEAWICPTAVNTDQAIVSTLSTYSSSGMELHVLDNAKPVITLWNGTKWVDVFASEPVKAGVWVHIATTFDGQLCKIYVNGNLSGSIACTYVPGIENMCIGRRSSDLFYFKGQMDEIAYWNYARSETEIKADMSGISDLAAKGLLSYYKFNQGFGAGDNRALSKLTSTASSDYDGWLCNFALTGSASNFVTNGAPINEQMNNSLVFDGINDFVNCGTLNSPVYTYEAWVCPKVENSDQAIISTLNVVSNSGIELHIGENSLPLVSFWDGSKWVAIASNKKVVLRQWVHLAVSYDGKACKLYVNGSLVASLNSIYVPGVSPLCIGKRSSGDYYFEGEIDNVMLWNVARTQQEIKRDMLDSVNISSEGLMAYYKFNQGVAGGANTSIKSLASDKEISNYDAKLYTFSLKSNVSNFVQNAAPYVTPSVKEVVIDTQLSDFSIFSNTPWKISGIDSWLSVDKKTNDLSGIQDTCKIELVAIPNSTGLMRADTITITDNYNVCYDVVVKQKPSLPIKFVSTDSTGNLSFSITCSKDSKIIVNWGKGVIDEFSAEEKTSVSCSTSSYNAGDTVKVYAFVVKEFAVYRKSVSYLDVSNCDSLTSLNCNNNLIESLDISNNKLLTKLYCFSNKLKNLNLANNNELLVLNCDENLLSSLDISNNMLLTRLNCSENNLTTLDLTKNNKLVRLNCYNNKLNLLDVNNCTALTYFDCSGNNIKCLNVSNSKDLEYLFCEKNKLETIDISKNSKLKVLYCSRNFLRDLDLSNNSFLQAVDLSYNNIGLKSLPINKAEYREFIYAPQLKLDVKTDKGEVDLSGQLTAISPDSSIISSVFTWVTTKGDTLINGTDYEMSEGVFYFPVKPEDSVYCTISNSAYPDFVDTSILCTVKLLPIPFYTTFTFSSAVSDGKLSFEMICDKVKTCYIDWGDGKMCKEVQKTEKTTYSTNVYKIGKTVVVYANNINSIFLQNKKITLLDVSQCNELKSLDCSDNLLTFKTLPSNIKAYSLFNYTPQASVEANSLNGTIDLSEQFLIMSDTTKYFWYTTKGGILVEGKDYVAKKGVFVFNCSPADSIYCKMTNNVFPGFNSKNVFRTVNFAIKAGKAKAFSFTSSTNSGKVGFKATFDKDNDFFVDWGNGKLVEYVAYASGLSTYESYSYSKDDTVKVYATNLKKLIIENFALTSVELVNCPELELLSCAYNKLTELNVANCERLNALFCNNNQLTSIALPNNTMLKTLNCSYNNFDFTTLPMQSKNFTSYVYAPQAYYKLAATNDTVDLSKFYQVKDVDGINKITTFTWYESKKNKLVHGTNYFGHEGLFVFNETIGDTIYCCMTNEAFPDFKSTNAFCSSRLKILSKIRPVVEWKVPSNITYGDKLDLYAANSIAKYNESIIPGQFYLGMRLEDIRAGENQKVIFEFNPNDSEVYNKVRDTLMINIKKAKLTVSVGNYTIKKGDKIPKFNLSYDGFAYIDSISYLDELPKATTIATSKSKAGDYIITVSGGNADNYEFVYKNGVLRIEGQSAFELIDNIELVAYPNPVKDILVIKGLSNSGFYTLRSVSGKMVVKGAIDKDAATITFAGIEAGTYILLLELPGEVKTLKVVKE